LEGERDELESMLKALKARIGSLEADVEPNKEQNENLHFDVELHQFLEQQVNIVR
jgi:hypothetical protein